MFLLKFIDYYTIGYPILMSILWSVGAYFSRIKYTKQESLKSYPKVSIVLSAYNEEETIQEAMSALKQLAYPNLEIIVVDDKSTDNTLMLLEQIKQGFSKEKELKILAQQKNGGKATALNTALEMVSGKYLLVLDADALLAPNSVEILAAELESSSIIGAVTGKPVVRNRSTLLGKLQTLEYVGIIDGIKRTQTFMLGAIMTVSGVIVMYRVSSLKEVGGFNPEVMTEDIDVTWKLHRAGWHVHITAAHFLIF